MYPKAPVAAVHRKMGSILHLKANVLDLKQPPMRIDALTVDTLDQVLDRIEKQDPQALQQLYEEFGQAVYSLAYAILRNRETAEEVTQDVFLKVWKRVALYQRGTNFRAWLLRLTRNQAIDALRRNQNELLHTSVWDMEDTPDSQSSEESARWIREVVKNQLSEVQRQAIELAFMQGLTHEQIADRLQVPLGTIKTRLRDGLQRLREALRVENLL
jgi:RNA polymerase sigma-70 factor (ECF subfamily)